MQNTVVLRCLKITRRMIEMKKINVFVTVLAGVILCLLLTFTACEDNSGVVIDPNATNSANQSDAYFFKAGDAEICLYMPLCCL